MFWGHDDGTFVAQDAKSGKPLWAWSSSESGIGGANGAGAAYMVGGREYVVMPFGGSSHVRTDTGKDVSPLGDALVAFALPEKGQGPPRVLHANPVQVPVDAPTAVAGMPAAPVGAKVVELRTHDFNFYPGHFTVKAGQRVAVHVTDTGLLPAGFAVNLPKAAIGLAKPLQPRGSTYLVFTAPDRPSDYEFFDSIQPDKYYAKGGVMHVTGS